MGYSCPNAALFPAFNFERPECKRDFLTAEACFSLPEQDRTAASRCSTGGGMPGDAQVAVTSGRCPSPSAESLLGTRLLRSLHLPTHRSPSGAWATFVPVLLRPHPLVPFSRLSSAGQRDRLTKRPMLHSDFLTQPGSADKLRSTAIWNGCVRPAVRLRAGPRRPQEVVPGWTVFGEPLNYTGEFTAASKEKDGKYNCTVLNLGSRCLPVFSWPIWK